MEMQDQRINPPEEATNAKPRKKKPLNRMSATVQVDVETFSSQKTSKKVKSSKRSLKDEMSGHLDETKRSTPDTLLDASGSSEEYRALRRKYLLLEDESFSVERDITAVTEEVKALEDEKYALLDQLVVLEGLVDPSVIQHKRVL